MFSSCNSTYSSRWVPRNRNQNRDRLSRLVISVEVEGRVISVGGGEQRFPIGLQFEFELQSPELQWVPRNPSRVPQFSVRRNCNGFRGTHREFPNSAEPAPTLLRSSIFRSPSASSRSK
ncbi:hypothetical protein ZOSMA_45G00370 [Zostera marina]|uniref:Uncharacterized protein n=1 Tax=Zostera marina TaxID=29655 RepID=A0A0K9P0A5_ZOSMR|nr:hypothetical protein ZOSMA_45G00370 [Zostera marina]